MNSGKDIGFGVEGATSVAWANDNETLFYGVIDNTLRSYRILRQTLDAPKADLVYEETDARFSVYVSSDKNRQYIFISSGSSTTSEERFISADRPTDAFRVFTPRIQDTEYYVYPHSDRFFVRYKDKANLNGKIYEAPLQNFQDKTAWKEIVPHNPEVRIDGVDILKEYMVLELRQNGLTHILVKPINGGESKTISFPEPVYSAELTGNPEYDACTFRYSYTSLNRPTTLYEYDIVDNKTEKLKEQEIP